MTISFGGGLEFPASPASEATGQGFSRLRRRTRNLRWKIQKSRRKGRRRNPAPIRNSIPLPDPTFCKISGTALDAIVLFTRCPGTIDAVDIDVLLNTGNGLPLRRFRRR
jgi:hypothetical protein